MAYEVSRGHFAVNWCNSERRPRTSGAAVPSDLLEAARDADARTGMARLPGQNCPLHFSQLPVDTQPGFESFSQTLTDVSQSAVANMHGPVCTLPAYTYAVVNVNIQYHSKSAVSCTCTKLKRTLRCAPWVACAFVHSILSTTSCILHAAYCMLHTAPLPYDNSLSEAFVTHCLQDFCCGNTSCSEQMAECYQAHIDSSRNSQSSSSSSSSSSNCVHYGS